MPYVDHAATTPVLEEVFEAMLPYLKGDFGNPSSVYASGRQAKKGLEDAREQVAKAVGAQPREVIFTAGGTEADNLALRGVAGSAGASKHVVTSAIEHHAVLHTCEWLEKEGFEVTTLPVDGQGMIEADSLERAIRPDTALVSIMWVNNEVGTIQDVLRAAEITKERSGAVFHTDAVQALGKVHLDLSATVIDLASFSAHKVGGPKGVGCLVSRGSVRLDPQLLGGGQERGLRSGTPNVAGIVGFGKAAEIAASKVDESAERLEKLRDRLQEGILASIDGVSVNGEGAPRVPGILNVIIDGVEGEALLLMLDEKGIEASSGSACTSGSLDPSHVLTAMGVPTEKALGSLRLSFGSDSTDADVDEVLRVLPPVIERLRSVRGSR
jgi:cysteine desulfurase